ncbi:MAG: branched-chain amino acid ABC transporter substrate-binding protein, partial [Alphaproteobacteria bacterium]
KEDGQCSAEGGQTAATKLSANQQVVVVVGPSCSSEAVPGAPILWKQGISSIGVSSSSPVLTDPNRGPGYDGFLRIAFNDLLMGREMATYVKDVLKLEKVATIHDGSPYAEKLIRAFQRNYKELGGDVCADEAIAPTDVDMRPVLTRIATCKPKWIYMPVFLAASGHIARQSKEISGLEGVTLVGTDVVITKDFLEAAGKASVGFQFATTALEDEAKGKGYGEMIAKYKAKFGEDPVGGFHHYGYDALMVAAKAIEKVAKTDNDGNTYVGLKALRDALYATKGYVGLSGPVNCNQFGDCGFLKLAIYKFVSESKENFGIGKNPVRHYPEKFE